MNLGSTIKQIIKTKQYNSYKDFARGQLYIKKNE